MTDVAYGALVMLVLFALLALLVNITAAFVVLGVIFMLIVVLSFFPKRQP